MKHGIKTQIAKATGKSVSFVCQYFKGKKHMSWGTANKAYKEFPFVTPELWMNRNLTKIENLFSSEYNYRGKVFKSKAKQITRNCNV